MGWYRFIFKLSEEDKRLRRLTLDRYGTYAQLSALVPVVVFLIYRLATYAVKVSAPRKGSYDAVPSSPALKYQRERPASSFMTEVRKWQWWLGDDVFLFGQVWGHRDEWVFGAIWAFWLLFLCVAETGDDYLHLTKRCGIVAASQFPIHYLMALKSLNPLSYIFASSHEEINRWHRVQGRIIYLLLLLHMTLYLNFFVRADLLRRLLDPIVDFGVASFLGLSILNTTSLAVIRNFSYRVFFITHFTVAMVVPIALFFHAPPVRLFMGEALVVFLADILSRRMDTVVSQATVVSIPGTNLIKISAPVPPTKASRLRDHPGSHIYLSLPSASRPSSNPFSFPDLVFEFLFNPFTVADVDEKTGDVTLVARRQRGPITSALGRLARLDSPDSPAQDSKVSLGLEGPYGMSKYFPNFAGGDFDRVLLVAGGVGATFTVPLFRSIVHEHPGAKVDMVWAIRGAGDAIWAVTGDTSQSILDDDGLHIYLTGDMDGEQGASFLPGSGHVEMDTLHPGRRRGGAVGAGNSRKRPDLKKITDNLFKYGPAERVAVLFCGPKEMGRELRHHIGFWVRQGRSVWWHNESFGW